MTKEKQSKEYLLGYDAGFNKPNETNCHFSIFSHPEATKEWEKGNKKGIADKEYLSHQSHTEK